MRPIEQTARRMPVIERTPTLAEKVVDAIVLAVSERRMPFGSRLVEADIARELNVSRVPVREAFRLMESQGLVVNTPYRGICLMQVDAAKLAEILTVRRVLEVEAVSLAVQRLESGAGVIDGLKAALAEMKAARRDKSAAQMARSDIGFHRAILELSGNGTLKSAWEVLARQFQMIVGIAWHSTDQDRIYRQHVDLLALFEARNGSALAEAIVPHIMEGVDVGLRDFDGRGVQLSFPQAKP